MAFAGTLFNSTLPAWTETKPDSTDSVIEAIAKNSKLPPQFRAFDLLTLANAYLHDDRSDVEKLYRPIGQQSGDLLLARRWQELLIMWTGIASSEAKPASAPICEDNIALAHTAIERALTDLNESSDAFGRLHMYYVAAALFQKTGDKQAATKCTTLLNDTIQRLEHDPAIGEQEITAAGSVLNCIAYGVVPVGIPDTDLSGEPWNDQQPGMTFSPALFEKAERLKLRAVALADRLPATNHFRRKIHRDLALWYAHLGKSELAEQQKHILFQLVGSNDDNLLFPQSGACGHLVWWESKKSNASNTG